MNNPLKTFFIFMNNIATKQHLDKQHLVNIDRLKIVLQEILAKMSYFLQYYFPLFPYQPCISFLTFLLFVSILCQYGDY